jgi:hypothetical protein
VTLLLLAFGPSDNPPGRLAIVASVEVPASESLSEMEVGVVVCTGEVYPLGGDVSSGPTKYAGQVRQGVSSGATWHGARSHRHHKDHRLEVFRDR